MRVGAEESGAVWAVCRVLYTLASHLLTTASSGAIALADALTGHPTLTYLDLSWNWSAGEASIADMAVWMHATASPGLDARAAYVLYCTVPAAVNPL